MKQKILNLIHELLASSARKYIDRTKPTVVGITGSVGKTSCRMVVAGVLTQLLPNQKVYTSPKNFNSELGLVFSVFQIEDYTPSVVGLVSVLGNVVLKSLFSSKKYDIIILEYGIDHPGDMKHLVSIVQPDYSIFTKLDKVHGAYFEGIEEIGKEKFALMNATKIQTYLNYSDEFARNNTSGITADISWYNGKGIEVSDHILQKRDTGIVAEFKYESHTIETNMIGKENADYIVLGMNIVQKMSQVDIPEYLAFDIVQQPGRCSIFEGIKLSICLDSTYNASPASMTKMIQTVGSLRNDLYPEHKIICVLGDMRELGEATQEEHEKIADYLDDVYKVFTVGPEMKKYLPRINKQSFLSAKTVGGNLQDYLRHSSDKFIILFKGSQNTIFTEEVLKQVLKYPQDAEMLVRQSTYWLDKKNEYFEEVSGL